MATITETDKAATPAPASAPPARLPAGEQRVALHSVSWSTYQRLIEETADRRRALMAYSGGVLELMSPGPLHEYYKLLLRQLIELMTEVYARPRQGMGSTHWQRDDLERGIEPDECYYLTAEKVAAARRLPLDAKAELYPAPDLVVEVDLSPSAVDRAGIYASLGVPEVWRFDGAELRVDALEGEGGSAAYRAAAASRFFPVPPAELTRWLLRGRAEDVDDLDRARKFRAWLRAEYPPAGAP